MDATEPNSNEEIFSRSLRAGRRTYFFDVRATRADDFYLTITESKKEESKSGEHYFRKHKIYLYKEDLERFGELLAEVKDFIIAQKGETVISDKHDPNFEVVVNNIDKTDLDPTDQKDFTFEDL